MDQYPKINMLREDGVPLVPGVRVEHTDDGLTVVLDSAGGAASGDYPVALLLLLEVLAGEGAVITDAFVDSAEVREKQLPREEVRLKLRGGRSYPLTVANETDLEGLRLAFGAAQEPVGRTGDSGGNRNKRIRFALATDTADPVSLTARLRSARGPVKAESKQKVQDDISDLLGIPRSVNSTGSTVRVEYLNSVLERMGLDSTSFTTNPARVQALLDVVGEPFDPSTDTSVATPSGGGNTVPTDALRKIRRGLLRMTAAGALLPAAEMAQLTTPTTDEETADKRASALELRGSMPPPPGREAPGKASVPRVEVERDPLVAAWVRRNAAGICELCSDPAPFRRPDGLPYLEVHHVHPLGKGGSDRITNAVALCPNCHRACHLSDRVDELTQALYAKVERLEREL